MQVELPSLQSLYLEMYYDDQKISSGTGFVIQKEKQFYFVTNRHNFTGRDNITGKCLSASAAIPNKLVIFHNKVGISDCEIGALGERIKKIENLYTGEKKLWFEHPILGKVADVVALKLTQTEDVYFYPYSIEINRLMKMTLRFLKGYQSLVFHLESMLVINWLYGQRVI